MALEEIDINQETVFYIKKEAPYRMLKGDEPPRGCALNKGYICSLDGIIRVCLIVSLAGTSISALTIEKDAALLKYFGDLYNIRLSLIVISVTALGLSFIIYLLNLLNFVNLAPFKNWNWNLLFFIIDGIFVIPLLVLGAICTYEEIKYKSNYVYAVRKGAFAASAFFAYLTALIYTSKNGIHVLRRLRERQSHRISS